MNPILNKVISSFEQLSSEDHNGSGTVTNFTVLDLGKLNENLSCGMGNFELLQDGGAVIGNGNITNIINEHLIETLRTEGGFHDVGKRGNSSDCRQLVRQLNKTYCSGI